MRRFIIGILIAGICLAIAVSAAGEIDLSGYTYDELSAIRDEIDASMDEIKREEAIANADRKIFFEEDELIVYPDSSVIQRPSVERLTEDAPWRTRFDWSSSDEAIVRVDGQGYVTAVGSGDAVITATVRDNPYLGASYTVHAAIPVEKITVWGPEEPIALGKEGESATAALGYSVEPEEAYYQGVIWSSPDEEIATVDEDGTVHGMKPGRVVITATSMEEPSSRRMPKNATYEIIIIQKVTDIIPEAEEIFLFTGETFHIAATAEPENANNSRLTYESDNPEIAGIDETGTITAKAPGECNIILEAADGYGASTACHVTVSKQVQSIALSEGRIRIPVGKTFTIETNVSPEDATNKELVWTSSNVFVARVANGTVEAVGQGDCEITCSTTDGSGISASVPVRVPTFSVKQEEYVITEKDGIEITIQKANRGIAVQARGESEYFTAKWKAGKLAIKPVAAGEGTVTIYNPKAKEDDIVIRIRIEDSAVYNQVSYPVVSYEELTRQPEAYEGEQISLYGKVLEKKDDEEGNIILMVGTGGEDYTDQVLQIRVSGMEMKAKAPEKGATATFYGMFRNEKIFSEALGSDISVPGMDAERIEND